MTPTGYFAGPRSAMPGALGVSGPKPQGMFKPGDVHGGYQFIGGDDTDPANWKPLGGAGSQGPGGFSAVSGAVQSQESTNRPGVLGPPTKWGRAAGLMQVLPATAQEMAGKLGVAYRPDLMTGTTPDASAYQQQIGNAYLQEGLAKTGNLRDALRYYHGGPNRAMWGPKTNAYADSVLARLGT